MYFDQLGLMPELLHSLYAKGYQTPTPIQAETIPAILDGSDVMGGAQTGTGKTAAFTLPLLQNLMHSKHAGRRPRALILTPTRELALQVEESVREYGSDLPLKSTAIFGGVGINGQKAILRNGVDILVSTTGRLLDHVQQGTVDLSRIEIFVLDEADRMLDMGFIHDIKKILTLLPKKRQNLLFSATFSAEIKRLANGILRSPKHIEVARNNSVADAVEQMVYPVHRSQKKSLLLKLLQLGQWNQVLVFTRTKWGANQLAEYLCKHDVPSLAIHGNKSQNARVKALGDFKTGEIRVLVATDIAARGLDIDKLPHVVNFDLPNVPEDYVHRIGRTGRAGSEGVAISLIGADDEPLLKPIEKLIGLAIPKEIIPDYQLPREGSSQESRPERGPRGGQRGRRPASNKGSSNTKSDTPKKSSPQKSSGSSQRSNSPGSTANSSAKKPYRGSRKGSSTKRA